MRKYLKHTKTMILALAISVGLMSCQKEETQGGLTLQFKAETGTSITTKSTLIDGLVVESFKINISEIELEFDDNDPLFATDSVASDYELDGPFEIDLMEEGNPLAVTIASNVELPAAAYDEIEFEFEASENSISDMFGKAFLVQGTINGTPFIFWTDEDMEVEIEFEHDFLLEEAELAMVTVTFDIMSLFDTTVGGINIMNATDGNADGIIEIYPGDPDGNEDLADMIAERLEDIIEAQEDQWEDD
ncbi:MAG: hypothetical protein R6U64_01625 [Bacteroidales bacterium]